MKKIFLLTPLFLLLFMQLRAQHLCCPAQDFAALASDRKFLSAHLSPLPFEQKNPRGAMLIYKADDGTDARAYVVKSSKPTKKILFVIHEWWGLNAYIRQEADRLQSELGDVTVYALDLYDGKTASDAKTAAQLMQNTPEKRIRSIIRGLIAHVGADVKIATVGWCYGGGWSLQAAMMCGDQAAGCVMYYGMPENDLSKLKKLKTGVLGIFAKNDKWITPEIVRQFREAMKKAKKNLEIKTYDADHAFANPSNPKYDKEFAEDAHAEMLAFLRKSLNEKISSE